MLYCSSVFRKTKIPNMSYTSPWTGPYKNPYCSTCDRSITRSLQKYEFLRDLFSIYHRTTEMSFLKLQLHAEPHGIVHPVSFIIAPAGLIKTGFFRRGIEGPGIAKIVKLTPVLVRNNVFFSKKMIDVNLFFGRKWWHFFRQPFQEESSDPCVGCSQHLSASTISVQIYGSSI